MLLRLNLLRPNNDSDLQLRLSINIRKDIDLTAAVDKKKQEIHKQ